MEICSQLSVMMDDRASGQAGIWTGRHMNMITLITASNEGHARNTDWTEAGLGAHCIVTAVMTPVIAGSSYPCATDSMMRRSWGTDILLMPLTTLIQWWEEADEGDKLTALCLEELQQYSQEWGDEDAYQLHGLTSLLAKVRVLLSFANASPRVPSAPMKSCLRSYPVLSWGKMQRLMSQ
jgi:hypothetical protein